MRNCCPRPLLDSQELAFFTRSLSSFLHDIFFTLLCFVAFPCFFSPHVHVSWTHKGVRARLLAIEKSEGLCVWLFSRASLSCVLTAQVPDDEQFVPDFQSDSCEYLICFVHFWKLWVCVCSLSRICNCWLDISQTCWWLESFSPAEIQMAEAIQSDYQVIFSHNSIRYFHLYKNCIHLFLSKIALSSWQQTLFFVFKTQLWERLLSSSLPPFWV